MLNKKKKERKKEKYFKLSQSFFNDPQTSLIRFQCERLEVRLHRRGDRTEAEEERRNHVVVVANAFPFVDETLQKCLCGAVLIGKVVVMREKHIGDFKKIKFAFVVIAFKAYFETIDDWGYERCDFPVKAVNEFVK